MSFNIVSRTDIGLDPVVRSSDGSPRPAISGCRWLTVHYTGVDVDYGDVGDTPAEIRAIERYASGAGKPNEYNYVIGQDEDDLVYEYAGGFRAAHSGGENSQAIGVLLLNGIGEKPTETQIKKVQWLREVLRYFGILAGDCETTPHQQMPAAATACPGNLIMARFEDIRAKWVEPAPPPPPPPPPPPVVEPQPPAVSTVLLTKVEAGDGWYAIARRVYGDENVKFNAARLQQANWGINTLKPGDLVAVPGRAV